MSGRSSPAACGQLERLSVVEDEDLGVVVDPLLCRLLDPGGCGDVLLGARRTRDLLIRDVADERVPERELVLALDRGEANRADELATHELVEVAPHLVAIAFADRREGAAPEDPTRRRPRRAGAALSSGRSVSMRAAMSACTVSGTARPSTSPRSTSMRANCSA